MGEDTEAQQHSAASGISVTTVEAMALLEGALHVAENMLTLFSLKGVRKIPTPVQGVLLHLAFVYLLVGFFSIHVSMVALINDHDDRILCYVRAVILCLLENVITYNTLVSAVCGLALTTPHSDVYTHVKSGPTLAFILLMAWVLAGILTTLFFTVDVGRRGDVCDVFGGTSRVMVAVVEGVNILAIAIVVSVGVTRTCSKRAFSPDKVALAKQREGGPDGSSDFRPSTGDGAKSHHYLSHRRSLSPYLSDANTLFLIATVIVVLAFPKLALDINCVVRKAESHEDLVWLLAADVALRLPGILLFPILLCRYPEARDNCRNNMCRKWRLEDQFEEPITDSYQQSDVCRRAMRDPVRRASIRRSRSALTAAGPSDTRLPPRKASVSSSASRLGVEGGAGEP